MHVRCIIAILWLGLLCLIAPIRADHIVGGHIEIQTVNNKAGNIKVVLKLYFDALNVQQSTVNNFEKVAIFRKRDNSFVDALFCYKSKEVPFKYSNEHCSLTNNLKVVEVTFETDWTVDPSLFTDEMGYYATHDRCCRNSGLTNIKDSRLTGIVYRTDFPPMMKNGRPFINSSPSFNILSGEYICANDPFRFNFDGTDSDGDSLSYQFTTPMQGRSNPDVTNLISKDGVFTPVIWQSGYDENNAIPGNPSLSIDPINGILSVKTNQIGLYLYSVLIKEYRKIRGKFELIGKTTRDFQLRVIDCPPPSSFPNPSVTAVGLGTNPTICFGEKALLQASPNPNWSYQWEFNGNNIPTATSDTLTAFKPGVYTLTAYLKNECSKARTSRDIKLVMQHETTKFLIQRTRFCEGEVLQLDAPSITGIANGYKWFKNYQVLNTNANTIQINESGKYYVAITDNSHPCPVVSDTLVFVKNPKPEPTITSDKSDNKICQGESILLSGIPEDKMKYQWFKNNLSISGEISDKLKANEAAEYVLAVTDSNSCTQSSAPYKIELVSNIPVALDPVNLFCGNPNSITQLVGSPSGSSGIYSGVGVTNQQLGIFDGRNLPFGTYDVSYEYKGAYACQSGKVTQKIRIIKPPDYQFPNSIITVWKEIETLVKGPDNSNWIYSWSPANLFSDPTLGSPKIKLNANTKLWLKITDQEGCDTKIPLDVLVNERIFIPNIITPNDDHENDDWQIFGIGNNSEVNITIFDRWGEMVFFSEGSYSPFDGTYQGKKLPNGIYAYRINIPARKEQYEGTLTIAR